MSRRFYALLVAVAFSFPVLALAQVQPNLKNGFEPYGSHGGSNLDTVNHMNGNWMLHAALIPEIAQRGALATDYALYVSSKNWQVGCIASQAASGRTCFWEPGGTGVVLQRGNALTVHRTVTLSNNGSVNTYQANGYTLNGPDGAVHQLYGLPGTADVNGDPTVYESMDTTGYRLVVSNPDSNNVPGAVTLMDRQGRLYSGARGGYQSCSKPPRNQLPKPGDIAPVIDDAPIGDRYCSQTLHMALIADANGNQMSYRKTYRSLPNSPRMKRIGPLMSRIFPNHGVRIRHLVGVG